MSREGHEDRCERCGAGVPTGMPEEGKRWHGRAERYAYKVTFFETIFRHWREQKSGLDRAHVTYTPVTLCRSCWGEFFGWVTEPKQAEHRRLAGKKES